LNVSPHAARLPRMLALAMALAALAALALFATQGIAQARKSACTSSATAHAHGSSQGCASSAKGHRRKTRKRHHVKKHKKAKSKAKHAQAFIKVSANCEDGSEPTRASDGSFLCGDGSEPECESGAAPTLSANGSRLQCTVPANAAESESNCEEEEEACTTVAEEFPDASCQDGSSPASSDGTQFFCMDGSEPSCEDGSSPTPPGEGMTPICDLSEESSES
jgi:hypothetical protein